MAQLRLDIPEDQYRQLMEIAVSQRRPIPWQAEVLLIAAISAYFSPELKPEMSVKGELARERFSVLD